jgi:hypothetical protein
MSESNRHSSVVNFPSTGSVQPHQPYNEQPEVRLPRRISPVAVVIIALPFIYCLATVAFTTDGMQRFKVLAAYQLQWLIGSQDGNRVACFILFGLGVVGILGFIKASIVRNYGLGAFGWIQVLLSTALICGAAGEWHLGQIGWLLALGIVWVGYLLTAWGFANIRNDQGPLNPAPQFQAAELPEQTVYGAARAALDEEIHEALRDKPPLTEHPGYRFKE